MGGRATCASAVAKVGTTRAMAESAIAARLSEVATARLIMPSKASEVRREVYWSAIELIAAETPCGGCARV